jgi:hypothetical protein
MSRVTDMRQRNALQAIARAASAQQQPAPQAPDWSDLGAPFQTMTRANTETAAATVAVTAGLAAWLERRRQRKIASLSPEAQQLMREHGLSR